jgi:hypothetical protein
MNSRHRTAIIGGPNGNVSSLGYQATSTSECGDRIQFAGTERQLTTVTVRMSDWTNFSDYQSMSPTGWTHPPTMTLCIVGADGTVGSAIHSTRVVANIPGHTFATGPNGTAFNVTFSFAGVIVPDEIIFGLAYNTQTYGAAPIGAGGPYNSLNFGLATVLPSIGTHYNSDSVYWNTAFAGFLTPGGPGVVYVFSEDTQLVALPPCRPL